MIKKKNKSAGLVAHALALGLLMKRSLVVLRMNDPLRMAGATAFFTTFALPPILIIVTQFFKIFIDPNELSSELIERLARILGQKSAMQVQGILDAVVGLGQEWYITVFGFIFLMFVATTLFEVIKNSLAQIWEIRIRPHSGLMFRLQYRARSLIIITLAGLLFFAVLFTEGVQALMGDYIDTIWMGAGLVFTRVANEIVFVGVVCIWFACLFRFLTAGRPKWHLAIKGGFFTALLFTLGKWILGYLLTSSNISTIYGASGSTVLIMLFVFYSALIFYYGGCFVKVLSEVYDQSIRPVKEAFMVETLEIKIEP